MPIYEYICDADGTVLEVRRPMADADKPLPDPDGKGRVFERMLSTFNAKGGSGASGAPHPGGCGCCRPDGGCGMR